MTDELIREPDDIRRDCARKLRSVETSGMFTALLGYLVGEDWATPRIEELRISPDRCILARVEGDAALKTFIGAEADLIKNIHGIADVAQLDGDELGYLLGAVAKLKSAP